MKKNSSLVCINTNISWGSLNDAKCIHLKDFVYICMKIYEDFWYILSYIIFISIIKKNILSTFTLDNCQKYTVKAMISIKTQLLARLLAIQSVIAFIHGIQFQYILFA